MSKTLNKLVWGFSFVVGLFLLIGSLPTISANVVGSSNTNFTFTAVIGFIIILFSLALFVFSAPPVEKKEEEQNNNIHQNQQI
ncbi:MAG: hypothetical protein QXG00_01910 [Candidatus Woesearchaeota archaeon]